MPVATHEEIREIIVGIAEVDPAEVGDDTPLRQALAVDSLMVLEIMSAIENRYQIKIPDEKAKEFTTVSAIVVALASATPANA